MCSRDDQVDDDDNKQTCFWRVFLLTTFTIKDELVWRTLQEMSTYTQPLKLWSSKFQTPLITVIRWLTELCKAKHPDLPSDAPEKVTLSVSPSGDAVKGSWVTFTCSSDASPPVTHSGYSLYKDGHFVTSGQSHNISDIQPAHSGLYYCQAWNSVSWRGIDLINSTEVLLDVQCMYSMLTCHTDKSAFKCSIMSSVSAL